MGRLGGAGTFVWMKLKMSGGEQAGKGAGVFQQVSTFSLLVWFFSMFTITNPI